MHLLLQVDNKCLCCGQLGLGQGVTSCCGTIQVLSASVHAPFLKWICSRAWVISILHVAYIKGLSQYKLSDFSDSESAFISRIMNDLKNFSLKNDNLFRLK